MDEIPKALEALVTSKLAPGEAVLDKLKGAFKEVLVLTDRRVIIVRSGFMTGHTFGSDVFQLPYESVSAAEVSFNVMTGYFEVASAGMQNTSKSYWTNNRDRSAAKAPNSVTLNSRPMADRFRGAATAIMLRAAEARSGRAGPSTDPASQIEKLWTLRQQGAITETEFAQAKGKLLGQ